MLRVIRFYATCSLAPFALALGADIFLVVERVLGFGCGLAAGLSFSGLALLFWYGLEVLKARHEGGEERRVTDQESSGGTPLEKKIEQMLTETRVVLPGAQALLGFQLIIAFTDAFENLSAFAKGVHLAALGFVALTVIWLMAPAAFHRIVYAGEDTVEFHKLGSRFLLAASIALAFGIAGDLGVVVGKVAGSSVAGVAAAVLSLALLIGLWHLYPLWKRRSIAKA